MIGQFQEKSPLVIIILLTLVFLLQLFSLDNSVYSTQMITLQKIVQQPNLELKSEERISRRDQTEAEIVLTEQIEMKKSIVAICKEEEFLHLQTKRSSFIIDKQRKWAYCEHAKVCVLQLR